DTLCFAGRKARRTRAWTVQREHDARKRIVVAVHRPLLRAHMPPVWFMRLLAAHRCADHALRYYLCAATAASKNALTASLPIRKTAACLLRAVNIRSQPMFLSW